MISITTRRNAAQYFRFVRENREARGRVRKFSKKQENKDPCWVLELRLVIRETKTGETTRTRFKSNLQLQDRRLWRSCTMCNGLGAVWHNDVNMSSLSTKKLCASLRDCNYFYLSNQRTKYIAKYRNIWLIEKHRAQRWDRAQETRTE